MVRIKLSVARRKRKKKVLKQTKGQFGHRSKRYRQAKRSVIKGMAYAYRDRKVKKRLYKNIWVIRINAACKKIGFAYNRFINGLSVAGVEINRKMLSELAVSSPEAFNKLVETAKRALEDKKAKAKKNA